MTRNALGSRLALAAALTLLAPVTPAWAEAPPVGTQVPGYYRTMLGEFEITALYDGAIQLDTSLLRNAQPEELNRMLARMFVGNPKMQTAVNAYLINTGPNLVLIDAGAATLFGPGLGNVLANLNAAGYRPEQVDTVLITHLHGDHIGGLAMPDGAPAFPNATVFVPRGENDFWLSSEAEAAAPEGMRGLFKMARDVATHYQSRGRWKTFIDEQNIVPGIRTVKAYGHTPGHTAYSIESGASSLLVWGDVIHAHAVQFAKPAVTIEFDVTPRQAIATRRELLASTARSGTLVGGMHLPFPGLGHVRADGDDSYSWVPVEFAPLPPRNQ